MALIPYLEGDEPTSAARMNALFEALDLKVFAAMDGKSLLFLAGDRLSAVKRLLGAKYFFLSGNPTYAMLYGGSTDTNYDHAFFEAYAAGLSSLETDDTYQIVKTDYVAWPPELWGSLEAHRIDGRWVLESTGPIKNLADVISETQNLNFDFVSPADGDPVNYWPEKTYRTAQAEIIIEGPTAITFPAKYNKFNFFRFNNLGSNSCTITFKNAADATVHTLVLPARQSRCLRRTDVASGYLEGGRYFQEFITGDFRFYSRAPVSRDVDALGHNQKAPHESDGVNCIINPAIVWDFLELFESGTPRFYLDHTEACDMGPHFDGAFPALTDGVIDETAIIADAIIHVGKLAIAEASGGGLVKTGEEFDYTGIEQAITDFLSAGFTAIVGDNSVTVSAGAPLQDFFPRTTNLFSYQQPYGCLTAEGGPVSHPFFTVSNFVRCPVALLQMQGSGELSYVKRTLKRYVAASNKTLRQCVDTITNLLTLEHGDWGRNSTLATETPFLPLEDGVTVDPASIPADQNTSYQTFTQRTVKLTPFGLSVLFKSTLLRSERTVPDDYLFGEPTEEEPEPAVTANFTIADGDFFEVVSGQLVNNHAVRFGPPYFPAFPASNRELSLTLHHARFYGGADVASFGVESTKANPQFTMTHFNPAGLDYGLALGDKRRSTIRIASTIYGTYSVATIDDDEYLLPLDFEYFPVRDLFRAFHAGEIIPLSALQPITEGSDDFPPVDETFRHQPILSVESYNALAQVVNMITKVSVFTFAQVVHKYPEALGDPVVSAMNDVVYIGLDAASYRFLRLPSDQTTCFGNLRPAAMYSVKGGPAEAHVWAALGVAVKDSGDLPDGYAAAINTAAVYATFAGTGEGFITAQPDERIDNGDGTYTDEYQWEVDLTEQPPGSSGLLNADSDPINVLALSGLRGEVYDGTEVVGEDFLSTFEWIQNTNVSAAAAGLGFAFEQVEFVQRGRFEVYSGAVTGSTTLGTWAGVAIETVPYASPLRAVGSSVGGAAAIFHPFTRHAEPFLSKGVGLIKVSYSMAYNDADDPAHGGLSGCTPIARTNFVGFVEDAAGDWVQFRQENIVTDDSATLHCLRLDTSLMPAEGETDELTQISGCTLDIPFNVSDSAAPPGSIGGGYQVVLPDEFRRSNAVVECVQQNVLPFQAHEVLNGVTGQSVLVSFPTKWFHQEAAGCDRGDDALGDLVRYYLFKDTRAAV